MKRQALLVLACLSLAACQTTAPAPSVSGERPGTSDAVLAKAQHLADDLLSNAVIEDVVRVYVAEDAVA
jgi:hypothetical protein